MLGFTESVTVGELRRRLIDQIEGSESLLSRPNVRMALDQAIVPDTAVVSAGQEVAVLPIFSGG